MPYPAGTQLGPYVIDSTLGRGGMGEVYRATDTRLDRVVALKVLPTEVVGDEGRRERFMREAKALARLQHPHVCSLYDVGVGDIPYLVMELVAGRTLAEHLASGVLPLDEVRSWLAQVGSALHFAHVNGIVHRDLKPSNLMVTDGGIKLLDFGLAALVVSADPGDVTIDRAPLTGIGAVLGTPGYMSPEQATGGMVDARSDVFTFGVLCYELLTGVPAFRRPTVGESLSALFGPVPVPPSRVREAMSPAVDAPVLRCLQRDPQARFQTVEEALAALMAAFEARPAQAVLPALPQPSSPIIGRDQAVRELADLVMEGAHAIVTLTGPGGTGKTRLALEVAHQLRTRLAGGVAFAPLTAVTDATLLGPAIAKALDVGLEPHLDAVDAIAARLRDVARGTTLVVLDNFEQLVDGAPLLTRLIAVAPMLRLLVTSRSVLRLSGEFEYAVPPLDVPSASTLRSVEALARVPSVALFVERARSVSPSFALTPANASAVADICLRLDGLPLALELASARVRLFPPQTLLPKLERRLQVLTSGARDLPQRQQTLRNTIDWSYGLLSDEDKQLFRRLAIFAGGCSLEAVEAVCFTEDGADVLGGVASLVDQSLVRQRSLGDAEPRISMLETIREYAGEHLRGSPDHAVTARAHAAYYLLLAEDGSAAEPGPAAEAWLETFELETPNLRAAFDWMLATGHVEWSVRLGSALVRFWHERAHVIEGRARLQQVAALRQGAVSAAWARLLTSLGVLESDLGLVDEAEASLVGALRLAETLGERSLEATILNNLGVHLRISGKLARARQQFEQARRLWAALGDERSVARSLSNLAAVALAEGDHDAGQSFNLEALAVFERRGDTADVAVILRRLGDALRQARRFDEADQHYQRALVALEAVGDRLGVASVQADRGTLALERGDGVQGCALLLQAFESFVRLSYHRGAPHVVEELAIGLAQTGKDIAALRLAGGASALRSRMGLAPTPEERTRLALTIAPLRARVGEEAWRAGQGLDAEALLAEARAAAAASD